MTKFFSRFSWNVWLTAGLFAALVVGFFAYVRAEKQIDHAHELRHQSLLLAHELRQSSDDLTRMVRTYAAIGDPSYKQYFHDILAIRDGKKTRPAGYHNIYWDFVVANKPTPLSGSEQAIALLEMMRQAGFTEQEFMKLAEAKANSDALTATEFAAMKLVETTGPEAEQNRAAAIRMLFDARYLQAKAAIMKPIEEFITLVDTRTVAGIQAAETKASFLRTLFVSGGLGLMLMLLRTEKSLRTVLGGSAAEVHAHLTRIGRGDFSTTIPLKTDQVDSVLGRLFSTQANLQKIEQERTLAQAALKRSEERQELALAGADLGLWDWDVPGGKTLFDGRWCSMLGYRVDELEPTVNTWITLMHPEDAPATQAKLERYLNNEARAYEAEFRMRHKAGHLVWILVRGKVVERDQTGAPLRMVGTHMDITGRKQTEAALKENEARYRTLVKWSPEPLIIHRDGMILYVNPAAIALLGAGSAQDLVGKPVLELVHPDFHETTSSRMSTLTDHGAELPLAEMKCHKLDGTVIDVEVSSLLFPYDGVPAFYASARDITARKQTEEKLRLANLLSDQALDLTKAGYWHVPLDGSGWYNSSERAATIFGDIPREGWRYRVMEEWFVNVEAGDKTAAARTLENYVAAVEGRVPKYDAIYAYKRPVDGRIVWIHALAHVVKDAAGKATDLYGVTQDITESKLAEQRVQESTAALRASEEELRQMAEAMPQIVWITRADGWNTYFSQQWVDYTGLTLEESHGYGWSKPFHPDDKSRAEAAWKNAVENRGEYSLECQLRRADGSYRWWLIRGIPLLGPKGEILKWFGTCTDIHRLKQSEQAILDAKEVAEAAAQAKSDFLATMSHEIRTPMNGVLGFTELLLTTPLDDKQSKYATIIKNSGETLLTIINDILDFSKLEAGKITLDPQPFDLAQTIEEITALLGPQAQDKTIGLRVDYPPHLPRRLVADANRLRQIGLNLVGNALKFTERGSVTVRVSAVENAGGRFLRLEVIDTGLGIPKDKQAQLFQKFAQADASTTRRFGGTGLGLAISKRLVEAMGGEVGLDSEPGLGSTFWFTFPLVEATAPLPAVIQRPSTAPPFAIPVTGAAGSKTAGLRVLVAEDGLVNQMFVTTLLESFGCQADVAVDGREAVQLYRTRTYDLILMDCRMPEMDGFEATAEIRKFERLKSGSGGRIPIIALTASVMQDEQQRCLQVGMDACLTKPFRAHDLKEILKRWTTHSTV